MRLIVNLLIIANLGLAGWMAYKAGGSRLGFDYRDAMGGFILASLLLGGNAVVLFLSSPAFADLLPLRVAKAWLVAKEREFESRAKSD